MGFQSVDRGTVAVWRLQALAGVAVAALVMVGVTVPLLAGGAWLGPVLALVGGLLAVAAGLALWLPAKAHARLRYRLDEHGLTIEHGILWRHRIIVPRVRVQHSDISQGPLQRAFGVATLRLYTAGSRFTVNSLPGLADDRARALRRQLLDEGDGDAV
ncbi:PH domain-containing protein [Alloalcanivorax marinus]|uniref:PH domain-containing protein n=1 Tax=Alloalcanivorax marinus TaxID=1177169 RepID=UPI00195EDE1E|nr:PH domain-containing protein [Alloalcanivorax marinus]MBM7333716.1 PH domain-containing protein [Alloalcanivorax marinus]